MSLIVRQARTLPAIVALCVTGSEPGKEDVLLPDRCALPGRRSHAAVHYAAHHARPAVRTRTGAIPGPMERHPGHVNVQVETAVVQATC